MTKKEIKKATTPDVVYDMIKTYSWLIYNYNTNRAVKQYDKHCRDLAEELIKREVLTEELVVKLMDQ